MQKKVFLTKNLRPKKHPYLKLFFWSAICLILLVAVAPLLVRQKTNKGASQKPAPEKGVIVKEIPRSTPPASEKVAEGDKADKSRTPQGVGGKIAGAPVFKSVPEPQEKGASSTAPDKGGVTEGAGSATPAGQKVPSKEPVAENPQTQTASSAPAGKAGQAPSKELEAATAAKPVPSLPAGKIESKGKMAATQTASANASPQIAAAGKKGAPPSSTAASTAAKKAAPPGCKLLFVVQVGSFKDKQHAEEMERNLRKRGYDVVVRPQSHAKLGQLYVVQLQPVADEGKASTLMSQIGHEERVKPVILKVAE